MKSYRILLLFISLAVTASAFSACSGGNRGTAEKVKNVLVRAAEITSLDVNTEYSCKLKGVNEIAVSPKIPGRVAAVNVDVGDEVKKGQVLFTLDSRDIEAQVKQSQANLGTAKDSLAMTKDYSTSQQVLQAEQAVKQAQLQYDDAKSLYDKTKKLFDDSVVSKRQLDDAELRMNNLLVQLNTAEDSLRLVRENAQPRSIDISSAQVEAAGASVEAANAQLDNTVITSPISGVITVRNIDAGEMASNTSPSIAVIDQSALIAEVAVPDDVVVKIRKGESINVIIKALGNKEFKGVVSSVSPAADAKTQLYNVKIRIDNSSGEIKAGMFARVIVPVGKKDNVITIPNEAIIIEDGIQYVFVVENNEVKKKSISTGMSTESYTEVTNNINKGDLVILEGQSFLNGGDKVSAVK